jgi:hypothetical protein
MTVQSNRESSESQRDELSRKERDSGKKTNNNYIKRAEK